MASKLKKLWWLMLVFAVCNIAIALILFFGNKQKSPEESTKPIPQKNVYSIGKTTMSAISASEGADQR